MTAALAEIIFDAAVCLAVIGGAGLLLSLAQLILIMIFIATERIFTK